MYTPVECVDFIIHSVNDLLQQEFHTSLTEKDVHILRQQKSPIRVIIGNPPYYYTEQKTVAEEHAPLPLGLFAEAGNGGKEQTDLLKANAFRSSSVRGSLKSIVMLNCHPELVSGSASTLHIA